MLRDILFTRSFIDIFRIFNMGHEMFSHLNFAIKLAVNMKG